MTAIRIENLSKTYPPSFPRLKKTFGVAVKPPVEALKNVSFSIETGEIFGLIGRNGAGKTTLSKIIATLVQPSGGAVTVGNFDSVKDEVKVRSLIGLATAEERSFYWRLSCERNLLFFARLYGMKTAEARRKIGDIFERLNLQELAKRRFSEISTGNKPKLAIARALLPAPPILLLDEPTRSLDPLAADELRNLISALENVSILLTSHNLTEVEQLCQRVAVISKGEIRAVDSPQNLRRRNRETQQVKIFIRHISEENLSVAIAEILPAFTIENHPDGLTLNFSRHTDDEILSRIFDQLARHAALIYNVETKSPTLLDVLESYE